MGPPTGEKTFNGDYRCENSSIVSPKFVFKLMVAGFLTSFTTQTVMMVLALLAYWRT